MDSSEYWNLSRQVFVLTVNGEEFATTLTETMLLSIKVCELQRSNALSSSLNFVAGSIDAKNFGFFVKFVSCRDLEGIERA
jgi:hypothetical protein